ncbi:MAG: hypothetical protein ACPKPY_02895 [Nitrososphaeraceae archaeon]
MKFKTISILCIVVSVMTSLIPEILAQEFKEYESKFLGIKLQFPVEWENTMSEEEIIDFVSDDVTGKKISFGISDTENGLPLLIENVLTISVRETDATNLLELQTETLEPFQTLGKFMNYDLLETINITLNKYEAAKFIHTQEINEKEKVMQIVSLINSKNYSIVYKIHEELFDKYLETIEKIINSIQIIK